MFYQQLQKACKNANTTVTATLKAIGIGTANGTYWKNGSMPSSENVIQLAEFLGVSTDFLLKGNSENYSINISSDEKELLNYYKELDDYGKGRVIGKAEELAEAARRKKALETTPIKKANPKAITPPQPDSTGEPGDEDEEEYFEIPLAELPASAGTGIYLDSDQGETIKVAANEKTRQTDFAVKVSGDSMEPRYYSGDIVLVRNEPVKIGEIGIFVYEGEGYIKELGDGCLISLNPSYPNIQIENPESLFCQGRVISVLRLVKK